MNRRDWITAILGGASAAVVAMVPGTSVAEPTPTQISDYANPAHRAHGYFVRGLSDNARGVGGPCPVQPDEPDGYEGAWYQERVRAWFAGWLRAQHGA